MQALELGLGQARRPLGERGIAAVAGEHGGEADAQHRGLGMAFAARPAPIGHRAQALLQVLHLGRGQGDGLHRGAPGGGQHGGAQQRPGARVQRIDECLLGFAVGRIAAVAAREAARGADHLPVGGAVTGAGKTRGIDEGLGQQEAVTMDALPILGQAPQVQRQDARGQIGDAPGGGEDQEPGVVGQQMQALVVQHPRPADPGIAGRALERRRLPAEQRQPAPIERGDVAQRLAE